MALLDANLVEARGDAAGSELDLGVGVDLAGGAVDDAWPVLELGDVLEAVGVEGEVIRDVDVRELRPEDELLAEGRLFLGLHLGRRCLFRP